MLLIVDADTDRAALEPYIVQGGARMRVAEVTRRNGRQADAAFVALLAAAS
ncbi:MAG: hypothetical protein ABI699_02600 [Caldimonas sp.]